MRCGKPEYGGNNNSNKNVQFGATLLTIINTVAHTYTSHIHTHTLRLLPLITERGASLSYQTQIYGVPVTALLLTITHSLPLVPC